MRFGDCLENRSDVKVRGSNPPLTAIYIRNKMNEPEYVMSDVPTEPLKAHLDENGLTLPLGDPLPEIVDDTLPEGATLVLDSSEFQDVKLQPPESVPGKQIPMTQEAILAFVSKMVASGEITTRQAADIRRRFGISGSIFTKKKVNKAAKK